MPRSCSDRWRAASAANAGFLFVVLSRVAHALGIGEGCAATASYPEVRSDHHHANSFRTAPSLCADVIFGKDRWPLLAATWAARPKSFARRHRLVLDADFLRPAFLDRWEKHRRNQRSCKRAGDLRDNERRNM